jgi:hypothetical protein
MKLLEEFGGTNILAEINPFNPNHELEHTLYYTNHENLLLSALLKKNITPIQKKQLQLQVCLSTIQTMSTVSKSIYSKEVMQ